jgi:hypothetical protein
MRFIVSVLTFLVLSTTTPFVVGAETPSNECYHYAYSQDTAARLYTLLQNNSVLVGNDIIVVSNCPVILSTNLSPSFESSVSPLSVTVPIDSTSFTITVNNTTYSYSNITIYPASEFILGQPVNEDLIEVSKDSLWFDELLAHAITFIILFFLSTSVVYRVARNRVDRSIEVVI